MQDFHPTARMSQDATAFQSFVDSAVRPYLDQLQEGLGFRVEGLGFRQETGQKGNSGRHAKAYNRSSHGNELLTFAVMARTARSNGSLQRGKRKDRSPR